MADVTPNLAELRPRPGRRSLGERPAHTLRTPKAHFERYEQLWREAGYPSLNAYLVATLARAHELEVPDWAEPTKPQDGSVQGQLDYRIAG
jgi:hypothetical protein